MDAVTGGEVISGEAASTAPTTERNPHPATVLLNENALPTPFLRKTYDMVEDPTTDAIISWSPANNSLIIWDWQELSRDLLPKYFKHNNFTSFVRQLNTYKSGTMSLSPLISWNNPVNEDLGFRKMDPDRWEFANEGFLRGQKHLLKTIKRRKSGHQEHGTSQSQDSSSSSSLCVEVGKFGIEEEVEQLKRDKNVLMQELVKLRQNQQSTDNKLHVMVKRLQDMEHRQQQIMSFLAKAVQNPTFLSQFLQKQNDNNNVTEANKKRRLREDGNRSSDALDHGQIVKYQPLRSLMNVDDPFLDGFSSPNRVLSGVTLQEVLPATSGHVAAAGQALSYLPSASTSLSDTVMPAISQIPQESINEFPTENYMDTTEKNVSEETFISPSLFLDGGSVPVQLDGISQDLDIDELMSNCDLFEEYLAQSPVPGDGTTTLIESSTEQQLGFLTSETEQL